VKPSQGPQLVGRERERRILIEALTAATDSRSTLVDVSGPQGIGKTSLLQWFEVEATQLGYTCLTASGFRQESNHPNGALTRLLSATLTDASLHDLIEPYDAASLKSALPGIRDPANGADEPVTQIESLRALHAILTVIGEIGSGLVIIVDNIEFVDEMTLAALSYVCRRGIGAPLLIVAATRVDALRHELAPSVSTRIALVLAPLDRSELARLVVDIPAPVQEQLLDVADGTPLRDRVGRASSPRPDISTAD
jgi:predicted ATPase